MTRPTIDNLEPRRHFAFTTSFFGSVLRILGGPDPVNIRVSVSLDSFRITDSADGSSEDILQSDAAAISLAGGSGNDRLRIDSNITRRVTIAGNAGNDTMIGGGGADGFVGGDGIDLLDYSARSKKVSVRFDGIANDGDGDEDDNVANDIENVMGSSANDFIGGNALNNVLQGLGGKDTIEGGAGNDTISGGNKNDVFFSDAGMDFYVGSAGVDLLQYNDRTADLSLTLDGVANDGEAGEKDNIAGTVERFFGGGGNDFFLGTGRSQSFFGGNGSDTLKGGGGGDVLDGEGGTDSILGEGGNDLIFAKDGEIDTVSGGSGSDSAERDDNDVVTAVP